MPFALFILKELIAIEMKRSKKVIENASALIFNNRFRTPFDFNKPIKLFGFIEAIKNKNDEAKRSK